MTLQAEERQPAVVREVHKQCTSRTHSHKALNLLVILFLDHIDLKNN
jgi:hypothetical protein